MFIYQIKNSETGKCYIGQTTDFKRRKREHLNELRKHKHSNLYLQNAFDKHGESSFEFFILEECPKDQANEREIFWLNNFGGFDSENNYNLCQAGGARGISEETREKLRSRTMSEETRRKMSEAKKGIKLNLSDEQRKRIGERSRQNLTGRRHTAESKRKMSEKLKESASRHPSWGMTGKHHSEEAKRKIIQAKKLTKDGNKNVT
mgnify:CR=1 FL=1